MQHRAVRLRTCERAREQSPYSARRWIPRGRAAIQPKTSFWSYNSATDAKSPCAPGTSTCSIPFLVLVTRLGGDPQSRHPDSHASPRSPSPSCGTTSSSTRLTTPGSVSQAFAWNLSDTRFVPGSRVTCASSAGILHPARLATRPLRPWRVIARNPPVMALPARSRVIEADSTPRTVGVRYPRSVPRTRCAGRRIDLVSRPILPRSMPRILQHALVELRAAQAARGDHSSTSPSIAMITGGCVALTGFSAHHAVEPALRQIGEAGVLRRRH
jgi:hypothetical protein